MSRYLCILDSRLSADEKHAQHVCAVQDSPNSEPNKSRPHSTSAGPNYVTVPDRNIVFLLLWLAPALIFLTGTVLLYPVAIPPHADVDTTFPPAILSHTCDRTLT
jgi:hypothetical protein